MADELKSGKGGSAGRRNNRKKAESMKVPPKKRRQSGGILERAGYEIVWPDGNAVKLTIKLCIGVFAVATALLMVLAGADLRPSAVVQGIKDKYAFTHASGSGFPVEIHGSRMVRAACVTKGTAVLTDTSFTIYDGKGREVISANHNFSSPMMECSDRYSLLFDSMGQKYKLRTLSGERCAGETEDSIICGDVSASGRFAFVTNSEVTNARVVVYSPGGELLHKWKSVDNKLFDIALNPSGKVVAMCGVSSQKGMLVSSLIVQQVGAKKNLREYSFEESLIIDIRFVGNSRIAVISDDFAAFIDIDRDSVDTYSYHGRTLNGYDWKENGEIALVFSGNSDGRNSSVIVIDSQCTELASIDTSMNSPCVDVEKGQINLLDQSEVTRFNFTGNVIGKAEVSADCLGIFTSQGKLIAKSVISLTEVK